MSLQGGFRSLKNKPPRISLGMAPLPNSHSAVKNPGNLKLAARGSFDGYYTRFARNLAASGRKDSIVRIGWECNHDRAWCCGADPQAFKDMFKRIADIVRKHNPGVAIEWCCVKKGQQRGSILDSYPGDDAVDIIGVNYYDNWPALNDERTWQTQYQRRF
ncbi:MAG TPA: hypothetical protein VFY87_27710 [Geminicoccaceae bacterium]|nr:hypothetical protein [Geminicoccaceae bacterium]